MPPCFSVVNTLIDSLKCYSKKTFQGKSCGEREREEAKQDADFATGQPRKISFWIFDGDANER